MSKQLNSILNKLPHATATPSPLPSSESSPETKENVEKETKLAPSNPINRSPSRKMSRIVAPVPDDLKKDIKRYLIDNPGETEKSLVLRGLRTLGFDVPEEFILDHRKYK